MEVLLLGGTGQLGEELRAGPVGNDLSIVAPGRDQLDLSSAGQIAEWVGAKAWSAVINAAAYTEVDRAESEPELAYALNATATMHLAAETERHGIPLIHISTDYVFDGNKGRP
jgi:dTDP-4-dehydrorhamnose reductase